MGGRAGLAAPCQRHACPQPGSRQGNPEDGAMLEEVPARLRAPEGFGKATRAPPHAAALCISVYSECICVSRRDSKGVLTERRPASWCIASPLAACVTPPRGCPHPGDPGARSLPVADARGHVGLRFCAMCGVNQCLRLILAALTSRGVSSCPVSGRRNRAPVISSLRQPVGRGQGENPGRAALLCWLRATASPSLSTLGCPRSLPPTSGSAHGRARLAGETSPRVSDVS